MSEAEKEVERWLDIEGTSGYQVSDFGRVRNRRGFVLKPCTTTNYFQVRLHGKARYIHALVLTAFRGPAPKGTEGAHDDGDKTNNRLDNLQWKTHKQNINDCIRHGTIVRGSQHPASKLTESQVLYVRSVKGVIPTGLIAKDLGVSSGTINQIQKREIWKWL